MGSRTTFQFPSRVNLSGPSVYCITSTWVNKAGATRLTWFTEGSGVRAFFSDSLDIFQSIKGIESVNSNDPPCKDVNA